MNVSIALAAYNGEKYICEQCVSILRQLNSTDELIISINPSTDKTQEVIEKLANQDHRIKVYICTAKSVISNFENAIAHCNNDIIFLSDQDDVWVANKLSKVLHVFSDKSVGAVIHDVQVVDSKLHNINIKMLRCYKGDITPMKILVQNRIQGSCLAFRREYIGKILPFPKTIPMHDSWIGMIVSHYSEIRYLDEKLILYRRHSSTVTNLKRESILKIVKGRLALLFFYVKRILKCSLNC